MSPWNTISKLRSHHAWVLSILSQEVCIQGTDGWAKDLGLSPVHPVPTILSKHHRDVFFWKSILTSFLKIALYRTVPLLHTPLLCDFKKVLLFVFFAIRRFLALNIKVTFSFFILTSFLRDYPWLPINCGDLDCLLTNVSSALYYMYDLRPVT